VSAFAEFTGDNNPIHFDEEYARQTRFGRPIAHGILVAGLISAAIGTKLPGPGTIYLHQEMDFRRPVYPGDTVTAMVEVIHIRSDKPIVTLATRCHNQDNQVVLEGKAVVLVERF
jgi:3-hydroxybutyryl-CoA dehydratase